MDEKIMDDNKELLCIIHTVEYKYISHYTPSGNTVLL